MSIAPTTQIIRILGLPELRNIVNPIDKAVYLSQNCVDLDKISLTVICNHFRISRATLKARTWSILLGHIDHEKTKTRYLAPKYESELAEKIIDSEISHKSMIKDETFEMVMQYFDSISLSR